LNGEESLDVDGVVAGVDWRDEAADGVLDGCISALAYLIYVNL
jgi:hypothetical protein